MKVIKHSLTALLIWSSGLPLLPAVSIQWGTSVTSASHYLSDGTQVSSTNTPTQSFTFALGTFDMTGGWSPMESNLAEWSGRWKEIDSVAYNLGLTNAVGQTQFVDGDAGMADYQFNNNTFSIGETVYVWGYNQTAVDANMQWALVQGASGGLSSDSNWTIPDLATTNQGTPPFQWRATTADTAVFGAIGTDTGEGTITNPIMGPELQFATIPEPSSLLFISAGVLAGLSRRRRGVKRS